MRWRTDGAPFNRFMDISTEAIDRNASGPSMTEASQIYLNAKGKSRPLTFTQAVNSSVRCLVSVAGDKSIGLANYRVWKGMEKISTGHARQDT